jgi:2-polyprenyl-3-methyl-5-hydroxy-6-metoxy-1,4-benzoquinol methylase
MKVIGFSSYDRHEVLNDSQTCFPEPLTRRSHAPELMDQPDVDRDDLRSALRFIRLVNRRLGGTSAAIGWLNRWTRGWPGGRELHLLDLGTGSADIPAAVVMWGARRGVGVRVTAVDCHALTLELARDFLGTSGGVELVQADALDALSRFGRESFDVVHAGMFLHHLSDEQVVEMLRQMGTMSRVGAIWNDLSRDALSRVGVRIMTIGVPAMVRHDAVVSVEKGFTRREALRIADRAQWERARYRRHLFGRFTLVHHLLNSDHTTSPDAHG